MSKTLLDVHTDEKGRVTGHTTLHSSDHDEAHSVVRTVEHDDEILERNKRMRLEKEIKPGNKMPVHEEDLRFAFSIPPLQWRLLRQRDPELVSNLTANDEQTRMKAAQRLALLYPQWCVMAANR